MNLAACKCALSASDLRMRTRMSNSRHSQHSKNEQNNAANFIRNHHLRPTLTRHGLTESRRRKMKKTLLVAAAIAFSAGLAPLAHADDSAKTTGVVAGAATGAIVAGPVGAVVGGAMGLTTGGHR
jgi:hypothetical protein